MVLLLGTDIEKQVNTKISGKIARVGGSVNQLLNYSNCTVEDINLNDGGYGKINKINNMQNISSFLSTPIKYIWQEYNFFKKGYKISRDRKTLILDIHKAYENNSVMNKYDCSISSNMIEHSPNPILLLLNFYFITKKSGYQYHAIPHYKYTYDKYRKPTKLEHFINDFENMTSETDTYHNEDYIQSAIVKDGWQKGFHEKYPVAYPYMHFHVFDESNTKELMEFIFEGVVNDIVKTDRFSDNVVFFKNKLNKNFINKYKNKLNSIGMKG